MLAVKALVSLRICSISTVSLLLSNGISTETCVLAQMLISIVMSTANDKFCDVFLHFQEKQGLRFCVNHLPVDYLHEISSFVWLHKEVT